MKINQDLMRQWINLVAIMAAFGTNILANIAPINDLTIGEISETFFQDVLITPASYAFAIWGLIYLGLISLAIYQVLPINREQDYLRRMGYGLAISSFAQIAWVFLFQYRLFLWSVLAMVLILIPLVWLYLSLGISLESVPQKQRWLVNFPISVYFGWISVATILNVALGLDSLEWNGWGISNQLWTMIMIVIATTIAAVIRFKRKDVVYCGVLIWALIAIAIKHLDQFSLAVTAGSFASLLTLLIIIPNLLKYQKIQE
ncbi:MAG TPA: hypothetical protein DCF68_08090 [Cyanothece sp. UBA12306]|nr:hypothetical protein [Cyanothece sp. UBA12306]